MDNYYKIDIDIMIVNQKHTLIYNEETKEIISQGFIEHADIGTRYTVETFDSDELLQSFIEENQLSELDVNNFIEIEEIPA